MIATQQDTTHISTKQLQRLVGLLLAKISKRNWYRIKKYGSNAVYSSERERSIDKIQDLVSDHLCGLKGLSVRDDNYTPYYTYKRAIAPQITKSRIRAALKYWENEGKVVCRRHGRSGNGYKWVLTCDKNKWDRSARKRKIRDAKWAEEKEEAAKRTKICQMIADQLSAKAGLGIGAFTTYNENITITRRQAEMMIIKLSSLGL